MQSLCYECPMKADYGLVRYRTRSYTSKKASISVVRKRKKVTSLRTEHQVSSRESVMNHVRIDLRYGPQKVLKRMSLYLRKIIWDTSDACQDRNWRNVST